MRTGGPTSRGATALPRSVNTSRRPGTVVGASTSSSPSLAAATGRRRPSSSTTRPSAANPEPRMTIRSSLRQVTRPISGAAAPSSPRANVVSAAGPAFPSTSTATAVTAYFPAGAPAASSNGRSSPASPPGRGLERVLDPTRRAAPAGGGRRRRRPAAPHGDAQARGDGAALAGPAQAAVAHLEQRELGPGSARPGTANGVEAARPSRPPRSSGVTRSSAGPAGSALRSSATPSASAGTTPVVTPSACATSSRAASALPAAVPSVKRTDARPRSPPTSTLIDGVRAAVAFSMPGIVGRGGLWDAAAGHVSAGENAALRSASLRRAPARRPPCTSARSCSRTRAMPGRPGTARAPSGAAGRP